MDKKVILLMLAAFLWVTTLRAQTQNVIEKRAAFMVAADYADFNFIGSGDILNIDSLSSEFAVTTLDSNAIYDCIFLRVTSKVYGCNCYYYVAYENFFGGRFYKLSGFRNSEFVEFFNKVLLSGSHFSYPRKMKLKRAKKYILNNVHIPGIDLKEYYRRYYSNSHLYSAVDSSSCYKKTIIEAYKQGQVPDAIKRPFK